MTGKAGCFAIFLLLLLFALPVAGADVEARLDRTRVAEGETVVLQLRVPGGSTGAPDLSPLAKDFDILSRSQSMHMSMINGRSSSSRGWQIVLAPRRDGRLEVPALAIDGRRSRPLTLEVLSAAQAAKLGPAPPVLLEADVAPRDPYVQQKVIYRVRVLSRVPLSRLVVSDPRLRDALVEPLGPETEYSAQRHGQAYRVVERRYVVFPQHSGPLPIEGPVLSARIPDPNRPPGPRRRLPPGRDAIAEFDRLFGLDSLPGPGGAAQTHPVRLRAPDLTLDVQAQPAGTASPWLPAESLALNDDWSSKPPPFRVGEPVTRTIAIAAQGLSPAQLPDLVPAATDGVKVYPDRSRSHARVDGDTLVAQKLIGATLVPTRAGTLTLPAVELAWWDTAQGERRMARLPRRTIEVSPVAADAIPADPGAMSPAAGPLSNRSSAGQETGAGRALAADHGGSADRVDDDRTGYVAFWAWLALALGLAWLATLMLWWRLRLRVRRRGSASSGGGTGTSGGAAPAPGAALVHLEQACRSHDPGAARHALLVWAAARWPEDPPRRLDTLAMRLGGTAEPVLAELDQRLYSGAERRWDGVAAWERLSPLLIAVAQAQVRAGPDAPLPPLYPQGA